MNRSPYLACLLSLLFLLCAGAGLSKDPGVARFTVLYTSDTHGHVVPAEDCIGLDQIAGVKKALEPSLLLDAGDFLYGTPLAVLGKGEEVVDFMKKAGYFAAVLGNHEFNHGRAALARRMAQALEAPDSMAIISSNIVKSDGSTLAPPTARATVAGVRVCLYGLTTQDTKTQTSPSAVADLDFLDPLAVSRETARHLRDSGCEAVIALAHIGNGAGVTLKSVDIAAATPGLDIMIDGHSHIEFEHRTAEGALVVSPGAFARKLGRLDVEYDRDQGRVTSVANTLLTPQDAAAFTPDAALTAEIAALQKKTEERLANPVGEASHDLDGSRSRVRTRESNLGNLCADALRAAHGTDFALVNGGNIRASIRQGRITGKDILLVFPFVGTVVSFQVTADELKAILEHGLRALPGEDGGFPHISGLIVHIRPDAPQGQRVEKLLLSDGTPLDPEKRYLLAVNSFLAEGGDGYAMLAGKRRDQEHTSPQEALQNYIQLVGTARYADGPAQRLIFVPGSFGSE